MASGDLLLVPSLASLAAASPLGDAFRVASLPFVDAPALAEDDDEAKGCAVAPFLSGRLLIWPLSLASRVLAWPESFFRDDRLPELVLTLVRSSGVSGMAAGRALRRDGASGEKLNTHAEQASEAA